MSAVTSKESPPTIRTRSATIPVVAPIGVLVTGFLLDGVGLHTTLVVMTTGAGLIGACVLASRGIRVFDAKI